MCGSWDGPGQPKAIRPLQLERASPDFRRLWAEGAVRTHGTLQKRLRHPIGGDLTLEYSAFAVDGEGDLSLVVCTPATDADAKALAAILAHR